MQSQWIQACSGYPAMRIETYAQALSKPKWTERMQLRARNQLRNNCKIGPNEGAPMGAERGLRRA